MNTKFSKFMVTVLMMALIVLGGLSYYFYDLNKKANAENTELSLRVEKLEKEKELKNIYPTNWELSSARATNVVRFLQEKIEIDPENLRAVGMSEYHPVASNKTPEGCSQNRRIEITLIPKPEGKRTMMSD